MEDEPRTNGTQPKELPATPIEALGYTPLTGAVSGQAVNRFLQAPLEAAAANGLGSTNNFSDEERQKLAQYWTQLGELNEYSASTIETLSEVINSQPDVSLTPSQRRDANPIPLSSVAENMFQLINTASTQSDTVDRVPVNELSLTSRRQSDASVNNTNIPSKRQSQLHENHKLQAVKQEDDAPISNKRVSQVFKQTTSQKAEEAETEFLDFVTGMLDDYSASNTQNKFWTTAGKQKEVVISKVGLERLHTLLWKARDTNTLPENVGTIVELYKVLERPLVLSQVEIKQSSDPDFVSLVRANNTTVIDQLIDLMDTATRAAKVILEIYYNAKSETSLLREELFNEVLDFFACVVNKVLVPILTIKLPQFMSQSLNSILNAFNRTLQQLTVFITSSVVVKSLSKLQYLCSSIIFATTENGHVLTAEFQTLTTTAVALLVDVYKQSDDRGIIIKELLIQTEQLPTKVARRYLVSGARIHTWSALMLSLLKVSGTSAEWNAAEGAASLESCQQSRSECYNYTKQIITYIYDHANDSSSSGSVYRAMLETLTEDAVTVLYEPDWPAAEVVLLLAVNELCQRVTKKSSAKGTVLGLEILGTIANGLTQFQSADLKMDVRDIDETRFANLQNTLTILLQSVPEINDRHYIATSYVSTLGNITVDLDAQIALVAGCLGGRKELPQEEIKKYYLNFLSCSQLSVCYDTIIHCILQTLHHHSKTKTAVSKALRLLTKLAEANPAVLTFGQVQNEMRSMLKDESSQVRDSAIALVASYLKDPKLYGTYFDFVVDRATNDHGLAPRKRAMSSLCDLYSTSNVDTKQIILRCLLNGLNDEEPSIQKLCRDGLEKYLFQENWDSSVLGDANDLTSQQARRQIVQNMGEILAGALDEKSERLFVTFFENISDWVQSRASLLADTLVDHVTQSEDPDDLLWLLSLFARANPQIITTNHLKLLQAFPVEERTGSSTRKSRYYSLVVFRYGLKHNTTIDTKFLKQLKDTMMKRLSAYSISEIGEAVPCLWSLITLMNAEYSSIARALKASITRVSGLELDESKILQVKRLGFIIGSIGRYCKLGDQVKIFNEKMVNTDYKTRCDTVALAGIKGLHSLLAKSNIEAVQKAVVQNIGQICIGNPHLFQTKIVEELFDGLLASDKELLKDTVMKIISEYIELDVYIADEVAKERAKKKEEKVDISGNANNLGSSVVIEIAQRYKDVFKQVALTTENESAYTAARLLNMIGKQGLTAPQEVAAVIIALMSSGVGSIASLARTAFEKMFYKHESTLPSQTQHGIKMAAETRRRMVGDDLIRERDKLKSIYNVLHPPQGKSAASAKKFFASLLRATRVPVAGDVDQLKQHLDFIAFVVNGVSCLNIISVDEVILVAKEITEIFKQSSQIMDQKYIEMMPLFENATAPEQQHQVVHFSLMSLCYNLLWHLRDFLKNAYVGASGKFQTPKLQQERYRQLQLDTVFTFENVDKYPECVNYAKAFHEAMELEFDQEELLALQNGNKRPAASQGPNGESPTKKTRLDS